MKLNKKEAAAGNKNTDIVLAKYKILCTEIAMSSTDVIVNGSSVPLKYLTCIRAGSASKKKNE